MVNIWLKLTFLIISHVYPERDINQKPQIYLYPDRDTITFSINHEGITTSQKFNIMYPHNIFPYKPAQIPFTLKYNHKPFIISRVRNSIPIGI